MESNDAGGEMLGENGVLRILRLIGGAEPQTLIEKLLAEIAERYPQNLTEDDVTVLLVRANGKKAGYTLRAKFAALRKLGWLPPLPDFNLANIGGAIIPALGRRWRAKPQ